MAQNYWKDRYFDILKQNQLLREENKGMSERLAGTAELNKKDKSAIEKIKEELAHHEADPFAGSLNSICGFSMAVQETISKTANIKRQIAKEYQGSHTPKSQPPAKSLHTEEKGRMFEYFYILGHDFNEDCVLEPDLLFSFPDNSNFNHHIISDFAFPNGVYAQHYDMTESGSAFYSILYSNYQRDSNTFVFTVKASQGSPKSQLQIPNREKEILYCCCVVVKEVLRTAGDISCVPIVPVCYCLISYFPCLDLHFQVLLKILSIRKVQRMSDVTCVPSARDSVWPDTRTAVSLSSAEEPSQWLGDEEIALLEEYYENFFLTAGQVSINLQSVPSIECSLPKDMTYIDAEWHCPVLFSLLRFADFFRVLCAAMHEKSVVFMSGNLDFLTSAVLAIQCLMRPFKWPHLLCPILPCSLAVVLEEPIPMLVGVLLGPQYHLGSSRTVCVNLDERRVTFTEEEPQEPYANGIKEYLKLPYKKFRDSSVYEMDQGKLHALYKLINEIRSIWTDIIDLIPRQEVLSLEEVKSTVLHRTKSNDKAFVEGLVDTQFFKQYVEGTFRYNE